MRQDHCRVQTAPAPLGHWLRNRTEPNEVPQDLPSKCSGYRGTDTPQLLLWWANGKSSMWKHKDAPRAVTFGLVREFSWRRGHVSPSSGVEGEGTSGWRERHGQRCGDLKAVWGQ